MVVDSCVQPDGTPAAVEYLASLGVDVAGAVTIIVATHWHDDHVRGISKLLEMAPVARFFAAGALRAHEFLAMAQRPDLVSRFSRGVDEFARVKALADNRSLSGGNRVNLLSAVNRFRNKPGAAVSAAWSLSPSAEDLNRSIEHIGSLLSAPPSGAVARIPSLEPNDASVVLYLETVAGDVLLGADLEHIVSTRSRGWHAVLDNPGRPTGAATFFKIPHHGSYNADCPEVWQHAVVKNAVCVVSPFERGKVPLPRAEDRQRIRTQTSRAFLTSDRRGQATKRDTTVVKTIRDATRSFRPQLLLMGHVQARSQGDEWVVRTSQAVAEV